MKIIMFGTGTTGRTLYHQICEQNEIVAFADNDATKWGKKLFGISVCEPEACLKKMQYDKVIISAFGGFDEIVQQCLKLGVPREKIDMSHFDTSRKSRIVFLKDMAMLLNEYEQDADVAEAGVYYGDFAKWINTYFPNRILHLFDTFEGFDKRDITVEIEQGFSQEREGHLSGSSVALVMEKMLRPEKCKIYKGYFPDTAAGIERKFCFVNLDMDLYQPTYNGLHFFQKKMTEHGIILVHDYYTEGYKGAKAAVDEFCKECGGRITRYPIGDGVSIMLAGKWD